mmetsp:Transcript_32864/g.77440  ORF Transcript_32864/g.77440 Transcript_32864/m.77440 type:complete len:217 (+) Transcript_32864:95-745(+)
MGGDAGGVERISAITNVLQLVVGVVSIMVYAAVTIVQARFFPFLIASEAGTMTVDFEATNYHEMQIAQGTLSVFSALLFLGRDTFCVSKQVQWGGMPAHQFCLDWKSGIQISIVTGATSFFLCVIGLALAIMETAEAQGGECIEYLMIEQFCNGNLLSDVQQRMAAGTLVADGAISCPQRIVKEVLPSMYAAWFFLSGIFSGVGSYTAWHYNRFQG